MHLRLEQGGNQRLLIVQRVVLPSIQRAVLDRIVEEPHSPVRSADQLLHHAVFKEGRLKGPFPVDSLIDRALPAGASPDLGDVSVHGGNAQQLRLGAQDLPGRVIDQAVGRDIEAQLPRPAFFGVGLDGLADPPDGAAVKVNLQPRAPVRGVRAGMLRLPGLPVEVLVFPLKRRRIPAVAPEFRLLHVDGLHPAVHRRLQLFRQIIGKGGRRAHIRNPRAVQDLLPVPVPLGLVPVVPSVPAPVQIILIFPPGDARHQVNRIPPLPPGADPFGQIGIQSVHHHEVAPQVDGRTEGGTLLNAGQLLPRGSQVGHAFSRSMLSLRNASGIARFASPIIRIFRPLTNRFCVSV